MNKKRLRYRTLAAAILAATSGLGGTSALAATVQGYVTEAGGTPLAGARVHVAGSDTEVFTDDSGRFTLRGVDAGQAELLVSYVGLGTTTTSIQVSADQGSPVVVQLEPGSGIEEIVVRSQRVAINDALNRYRASDGISNFAAADDIGQFVDQNVAENLQRMPGVAITRDQGEGRFVSVRGIDAGLSTVSINGMRIGTPEDGSRAVPLDIVPSSSVDLLEVNKVPTPDMPGDAVGGSVDIRSGSPFGREGRGRFDYNAEISYNRLGEETNPAGGINFSDVFDLGTGRLGVAAGINYQQRELESDNLEAEYDFIELDGEEVLVPIELQQRKYFVDRERLGANLNLEYRADEQNSYFLDALFSRFDDAEMRQRGIIVLEDGDLTNFDGSNGRFEDVAEDGFRRRIRNRTKEQDTFALAVGGEHLRGDWTFDYRAGHSITRESVPDEREGRFEKTGDPLDVDFTMGQGRLGFQVFDGAQPDRSYLDNANYALDRVVVEPIKVDDDNTNLQANAEWANAFDNPELTLKFGVDARMKEKDSDVDEFELRDVPQVTLDQFESGNLDYGLGDLGRAVSADAFLDFFGSNRDAFGERPQDVAENRQLRLAPDFVADEDVYAGYLMGTWNRGPWQLIAGARVEHTEYSADGTEIDLDDQGNLTVGERSASSSYTNVLPGLHLRYEADNDMVVRAAWTNTIARPSFDDISPRFEIDRDKMEIEAGNPDLDPYESSNLDLLLDWYPDDRAVVSIGAFYKDVENYSADFTAPGTDEFAGFDLEKPVNSQDASILGVEANVEMGLDLLVPSLGGFLVGANATVLDTEFEIDERAGETLRLPGSAHTTTNLYLGYEAGPVSTRLSYSYRDKYLDEIGESPEFDIWVKDSTHLDLVFNYRLTDAMDVRLEASNLTDQALELYQGSSGNSLQFEEYGRTFSIGLTGSF